MAKQIVRLALKSMTPDPSQYKAFDMVLGPILEDDLLIEFEINSENVIESANDRVVLTPNGLCNVADQMRKAIMDWHWSFDEHVKKQVRKKQTSK